MGIEALGRVRVGDGDTSGSPLGRGMATAAAAMGGADDDSRGPAATPSLVPHERQNVRTAGFSVPHDEQRLGGSAGVAFSTTSFAVAVGEGLTLGLVIAVNPGMDAPHEPQKRSSSAFAAEQR